ncbi:peptidoglycan-binding protein [Streptomyces sp. NPDC048442]|uniref:peptidoglycan-binding protein n=1 Tax=Streptomyces sp. NPDC048442 TaxID=3154823 RepID=UPI0034422A49
MPVIQFQEIQPAADCPCAGCAAQRRVRRTRSLPVRDGGHAAAHGARRAVLLVTAAGMVLGGGGTAGAADHAPEGERRHDHGARHWLEVRIEVRTEGEEEEVGGEEQLDAPAPQGQTAPLHGRPVAPAGSGATGAPGPGGVAAEPKLKPASRADIINRAKKWVAAGVPYSMDKFWTDGYRQDCSGYVSMAWGLSGNEWTGSLADYGVKVSRDQLEPGDILLFHNAADPHDGSHVTIFGGWTDYTRGHYLAYEQTRPKTRRQATPIGYWNNADRYVGYRYRGLVGGAVVQGAPGASVFPGARHFRPGQASTYVEKLGRQLVRRGFGKHYTVGPGPRWSEADRRNVEAFQQAQGWRGKAADGYPGPETWRRLFTTGTTEGNQ